MNIQTDDAPSNDVRAEEQAQVEFQLSNQRRASIQSLLLAPGLGAQPVKVNKVSNIPETMTLDVPQSVHWRQWAQNHRLEITQLLIDALLNILAFAWKFYVYAYMRPESYALSGIGLAFARGFAQGCLLNCALVLLPLTRGLC